MTSGPPTLASASVVARITTDSAAAERIADVLAESFDSQDIAASVTDEGGGRWSIAIHFRSAPNESAVRALAALAAGAEIANALVFETVAAEDWIAASHRALAPVPAGRFNVHGAHDRTRVPPNRIGIEIEAALAFGTGHHGTTRACLLALDRILRAGRHAKVLDVGTGSGVLAIAAARALHARVLASDIDTIAVDAARANARRNRVGHLVTVVRAAGVAGQCFDARGPFDLIFANILLNPLRRLAAPLARLLATRGHIVLSGLLPREANAAIAAYRVQRLTLDRRIELDGWTTLVFIRRGRNGIAPDDGRPGR
jgi:ribosomal protein L11 methyltransferase